MAATVQDSGYYELFETDHGNRILALNDERWFAWVEGQQGEILVLTDSDHEKEKTLQEGEFCFVEFRDDPSFRDMPHLFLEQDGGFQELILPNGLPNEQDPQKKIVTSDETVARKKLEKFLAE